MDFYDDDEKESGSNSRKIHKEFECPSCNANNPTDPPLEDGAEVLCNYCGSEFLVRFMDNGRLKFKEL